LHCSAYLPGFNITSERGTHALLATAVQPAASLRSDVKYVTWAGALQPTTAALWPLPEAEQERMHALVARWLELWRRHAAVSRGKVSKA
jgi:hypothetical protein